MTALAAETDYRRILRRELDQRLARQPRYSLRAFARELDLAPSRLSEVLSGKQGLSREAAKRIAGALQLPEAEAATFCDLVESQHARGQVARDLARIRLEKHRLDSAYHTVGIDAFQVVADWYHFAIIQLLSLPDAKSDPAWVARALDITRAEAKGGLARLKRLGLIEEEDGKFITVKDYVATTDGVPSVAIRKFHRQILEKAMTALDTQTVDERNTSAVFIPMDKSKVAEANRWIRNFRRRFTSKVAKGESKTNSVYCLAVQFFDLTHSLRKED